MRFEHIFEKDLALLMHEAEHGEPFAFVRFADGERAILENKDIHSADGWRVGNEWMRKALDDALHADLPRYYRGFACPCCDREGAAWYRAALFSENPTGMYVPELKYEIEPTLTYSNLFVNGNYDTALPWLRGLTRNWCVVSSAWGSDIRVPADWSKIRNLEDYVRNTADRIIEREQPTLVAAGPLGKVIIHSVWDVDRCGRDLPTILDIGSALDPDLFGGATRGYHDPAHPNRKKICTWNS